MTTEEIKARRMLILKGLSAGKTTREIRPEWDAKYGMSEDT